MGFTKAQFKTIREDFKKDLAEFEKKYNLKVSMGNISYSEFEFHATVSFESNDIYSEDGERKLFEQYCSYYGVKAEDFKYQFKSKGKTYEVVGFETTRPKYPIKARCITDKTELLFTRDVLKDIAYKDFKLTQTDINGNPL